MAILDYALLAEYARVDAAGLLTVVGASFERVQAQSPGAAQAMSVALRILLDEAESGADFDVQIRPPSGQYALGFSGTAARPTNPVIVDGRAAVILVLGIAVPLVEAGVYSVVVTLSDETVKTVPFVVEHMAMSGT